MLLIGRHRFLTYKQSLMPVLGYLLDAKAILSAFSGASSLDRLQVGGRQRRFEVYVSDQGTASSAKLLGTRTH